MQRVPFGATGLDVTPIGLGLAALGRPGYINTGRDRDLGTERSVATLRAQSHAVLDAAWSAGIRYFDAARSYGLAERFLADWLEARGIAPDDVVVGSKWGYTYTADWRVGASVNEVKDHSLPTLRRQLHESRAILGPWLRLYQIHSATLDSGVLDDMSVLAELAQARAGGLVIGLSVSGPGQAATIRKALALRLDGLALFGSVQATWNVLEPSAGPALTEVHAAGLGVIVKEALANGRLLSGAPSRTLADLVTGGGPDAIALAAVLAQPWANVVLSGAVTPAQVRSNVAGLRLAHDLGEEHLAPLYDLAEEPSAYWATRSRLAWT